MTAAHAVDKSPIQRADPRLALVERVAADLIEALAEQRTADAFAHVTAAERAGWTRALIFTLATHLAAQDQAADTIDAFRDSLDDDEIADLTEVGS